MPSSRADIDNGDDGHEHRWIADGGGRNAADRRLGIVHHRSPTGEQDEVCAKAAIDKVADQLK